MPQSLPPGGKVAPQGRMRGNFATVTHLRAATEHPSLISQRAGPLTASPKGEAQRVKKVHSGLIACVGATIGRPPTYRSNAFSGKVSSKANGHGRAMLAPTRVFRQSELPPRREAIQTKNRQPFVRTVGLHLFYLDPAGSQRAGEGLRVLIQNTGDPQIVRGLGVGLVVVNKNRLIIG